MADRYPTRESAVERVLPHIGVTEAVRRHKALAVLPVIALVGLALGFSLNRTPTYTAESRETIGRLDLNQPGALAAFQGATQGLASSYSRAIAATAVIDRVARRTGLPKSAVRTRLSASPVPESPVFVVRGEGTSEVQAIRLSREGASALRAYVANLNTRNPNGVRLFREFQRASLEQAQRREEVSSLERAAGDDPSPEASRQIAQARAKVDSAGLAADVARQNYTTSQQSQANVSLVQTLTVPQTASSDASARLQIALFVAIAVGVLMGIALATLRSNQVVRRSLSAG